MLEIINTLRPFAEDNYRRINVREYARLQKISPPTASKLLGELHKEGLLKQERERQYLFYYANKDSDLFIDMMRIFWKMELKRSGVLGHIMEELVDPIIILFGSLSKAEAKLDSDVDLAIFCASKKELDISAYEKKLKRNVQLMMFKDRDSVKSPELLSSILNGYKIGGDW